MKCPSLNGIRLLFTYKSIWKITIRSCNRNTVEVEIAVKAHKGEIHLVPRKIIIRSCNRNTVEVEIAVKAHKGEIHLVPRIPLQPSDTTFPFKFQRRQSPLNGRFAMTINKTQGQTLQSIGLDLQQPGFSHGLLYVALSRSGKRNSIAYLGSPQSSITRNLVYKEVL